MKYYIQKFSKSGLKGKWTGREAFDLSDFEPRIDTPFGAIRYFTDHVEHDAVAGQWRLIQDGVGSTVVATITIIISPPE